MQKEMIVLSEDKAYARTRIAQLEKEILGLGPEFYEIFNQSSETWHQNVPFDALRDRQSVLDAELQQLLGKKIGDTVAVGRKTASIEVIMYLDPDKILQLARI